MEGGSVSVKTCRRRRGRGKRGRQRVAGRYLTTKALAANSSVNAFSLIFAYQTKTRMIDTPHTHKACHTLQSQRHHQDRPPHTSWLDPYQHKAIHQAYLYRLEGFLPDAHLAIGTDNREISGRTLRKIRDISESP